MHWKKCVGSVEKLRAKRKGNQNVASLFSSKQQRTGASPATKPAAGDEDLRRYSWQKGIQMKGMTSGDRGRARCRWSSWPKWKYGQWRQCGGSGWWEAIIGDVRDEDSSLVKPIVQPGIFTIQTWQGFMKKVACEVKWQWFWISDNNKQCCVIKEICFVALVQLCITTYLWIRIKPILHTGSVTLHRQLFSNEKQGATMYFSCLA